MNNRQWVFQEESIGGAIVMFLLGLLILLMQLAFWLKYPHEYYIQIMFFPCAAVAMVWAKRLYDNALASSGWNEFIELDDEKMVCRVYPHREKTVFYRQIYHVDLEYVTSRAGKVYASKLTIFYTQSESTNELNLQTLVLGLDRINPNTEWYHALNTDNRRVKAWEDLAEQLRAHISDSYRSRFIQWRKQQRQRAAEEFLAAEREKMGDWLEREKQKTRAWIAGYDKKQDKN